MSLFVLMRAVFSPLSSISKFPSMCVCVCVFVILTFALFVSHHDVVYVYAVLCKCLVYFEFTLIRLFLNQPKLNREHLDLFLTTKNQINLFSLCLRSSLLRMYVLHISKCTNRTQSRVSLCMRFTAYKYFFFFYFSRGDEQLLKCVQNTLI